MRFGLSNPTLSNNIFSAQCRTEPGKSYVLEYKDSAEAGAWATAGSLTGAVGSVVIQDTNALSTRRFYRVRQN